MADPEIVLFDSVSGYRTTSLQYYSRGFSAVGARKAAGRFNRADVSAVYFALEPQTALAEYWGTEPPRPAVVLPAGLTAIRVIDLTVDLSSLSPDWQDWNCDWKIVRDAELASGTPGDCASWRCGDMAIAANCSAIMFPSVAHAGGRNVVIFTESITVGHRIDLLDPFDEIGAANPAKF